MTFVTFAQLAGGKLGWTPSRYEAYVLVLNLCGVAILYREQVSAWCERANWRGVVVVSTALLLIFAGYATQFILIPTMAGKEYQGPYQLHRFVTRFYRAPVAVDQIGYLNFENRHYVLDLSGLGSEAAREQRARARTTEWMDGLLASKDVGLAIVDSAVDPSVPAAWTMIGEMRLGGALSGDTSRRYIFYARRPEDVAAASTALERFAPTLPPSVRLLRTGPGAAE